MTLIDLFVRFQIWILGITLLWMLTSYLYDKVAKGWLFLAKWVKDLRSFWKPSPEDVTLGTSDLE